MLPLAMPAAATPENKSARMNTSRTGSESLEPAPLSAERRRTVQLPAGLDATFRWRLVSVISTLLEASDGASVSAAECALVDLVCTYTDALKRDGALPEHVVIAVRGAVRSIAVASAGDSRRTEALAARAVQHCITRYFADEPWPGGSGAG